jgi:hypothetical protein
MLATEVLDPTWWHISAIATELGTTVEAVKEDILWGVYRNPDRSDGEWFVSCEEVERVLFASTRLGVDRTGLRWGELTIPETADRLHMCRSNVHRMVAGGVFESTRFSAGAWRISAFEVEWMQRHAEKYATLPEVARMLGMTHGAVLALASRGAFKTIRRNPFSTGTQRLFHVVSRSEVEAYKQQRAADAQARRVARKRADELRQQRRFILPDGYVSAPDAVRALGVTRERVRQLCEGGELGDAHRVGTRWVVPESAVKRRQSAMRTRRRVTQKAVGR